MHVVHFYISASFVCSIVTFVFVIIIFILEKMLHFIEKLRILLVLRIVLLYRTILRLREDEKKEYFMLQVIRCKV